MKPVITLAVFCALFDATLCAAQSQPSVAPATIAVPVSGAAGGKTAAPAMRSTLDVLTTAADTVNGVSASATVPGLAPASAPAPAAPEPEATAPGPVPDPMPEDEFRATPRQKQLRLTSLDGDLRDLLRDNIPELSGDADGAVITPPLLRRLRTDISEILATEGYFSPLIRYRSASSNPTEEVVLVDIEAGPRTEIQKVSINFSGALQERATQGDVQAKAQRAELIARWRLRVGRWFRQERWSREKERVMDSLRSDRYASATMTDSQAIMDAQTNTGEVIVNIDSGPSFTFGDLQVTGLQRYPDWLLQRYNPPQPGEPYSRERLLDYQRALQNSPYFSTVAVGIDPDPAKAQDAKIDVNVIERQSRDLGYGIGYSSNTGLRTEISYRDRHFFDQAWDLRSALRIEQRRQIAYLDLYLPPRVSGHFDSFGVLFDRQDIAGLRLNRNALGVKRSTTRGKIEQRLGLNLTGETSQLKGEAAQYKKAVVASAGWTRRDVDDAFDPREGKIYQLDFAGSLKKLISDQQFFRASGKYQQWMPVGSGDDSVVLRAEAGQVFSKSIAGIPEDYLFRTGGSNTVRGYGYQSLGIQHPGGTTGGRVMAAASAEYVHWFAENWGGATFVDVGDAAESWRSFSAKQGIGIGGRYKTPAGPLALDVAYGRQNKRLRLEFSIAIAF